MPNNGLSLIRTMVLWRKINPVFRLQNQFYNVKSYTKHFSLNPIEFLLRLMTFQTKSNKNMHVQPICFMMQNPINNMELVTLSRDGLMCSWSIDSGFRVPLQSIQLTYNPNTEASSTVNDRMVWSRQKTSNGNFNFYFFF